MAAAEGGITERVDAVERLTRLFRFERFLYLIAALGAVAVLLFCAGRIVFDNKMEVSALSTLLGSSGMLSIAIGRLLSMWTQAMRLVAGTAIGGD